MSVFSTSSNNNSLIRQILVSAINSAVWIYGLLFLEWNAYEARIFYSIDISLFLFFGFFKTICSLAGEKSFYKELAGRFYLSLVYPIAIVVALSITKLDMLKKDFWVTFFHSPFSIYAAIMLVNYSSFFIHDFIYSGKYKYANPIKITMTTYGVVFIIGIVLGLIVNFSRFEGDELFMAIGIIAGRFGGEVFFSIASSKKEKLQQD